LNLEKSRRREKKSTDRKDDRRGASHLSSLPVCSALLVPDKPSLNDAFIWRRTEAHGSLFDASLISLAYLYLDAGKGRRVAPFQWHPMKKHWKLGN
jgi:hypothetical protein